MTRMSIDRTAIDFKLRQIFVPLLALAAAVAAIYSLLNWLLVARSGLVPLDEDAVTYWIPLAVSWVLVIVLIQPALGAMKADKKGNLPFLYHIAAVAFLAVPAMVAQGYVRTASGALTRLTLASEVASAPETKYYTAEKTCIDGNRAAAEPVVRTTGKNNENLDFDDYIVVPVCAQERKPGSRLVWIGFKFHKGLSNSLPRSEREAEYAAFLRQSQSDVFDEDTRSFRYLERAGQNGDRKGFAAALRRAGADAQSQSPIILIPHNEPFEQRSGNRLAWTFGSYAIGAIAWLGLALLGAVDTEKMRRRLDRRRAGSAADEEGTLRFLIPSRRSYGLPILLDANILVFVSMVFAGLGFMSFATDDLIRWGANFRPELHGLGTLRLITSQFVHGGIMHLVNNLYGLLFAGIFLLPVTGNRGLILCYLLAGLGGSVASAVMHPATVSVGASGSIFGLFGVLLTLLLLRDDRISEGRNLILINVALFVGINLALGSISRGIDNAAHVGGIITGAILGLAIHVARRGKNPARATAAE